MKSKAEKTRELEARKQRGIEAEKILNNPLVVHALRGIEEQTIHDMKGLDSSNTEMRDILWRDLQAANRFRKRFIGYVQSGKEARTLLQRLLRGDL